MEIDEAGIPESPRPIRYPVALTVSRAEFEVIKWALRDYADGQASPRTDFRKDAKELHTQILDFSKDR